MRAIPSTSESRNDMAQSTGPKDLFAYDFHVRGGFGGAPWARNEIARTRHLCPAGQQARTVIDAGANVAGHPAPLFLGNHRTQIRGGVRARSELEGAGPRHHPLDHLVEYLFMDETAAETGGAHLAGLFMKMPRAATSVAGPRSASGKMITGDFPPSSRVTRFRFPAQARRISFPTGVDPVNAILLDIRGAPPARGRRSRHIQ